MLCNDSFKIILKLLHRILMIIQLLSNSSLAFNTNLRDEMDFKVCYSK